MLDLPRFQQVGLISENLNLEGNMPEDSVRFHKQGNGDEIYGILAFKTFIDILSYPSVFWFKRVISSISLVDKKFNLMEGNDWLNALNKYCSGLLLINAAFPLFVLAASMSWASVAKYLSNVSPIVL